MGPVGKLPWESSNHDVASIKLSHGSGVHCSISHEVKHRSHNSGVGKGGLPTIFQHKFHILPSMVVYLEPVSAHLNPD